MTEENSTPPAEAGEDFLSGLIDKAKDAIENVKDFAEDAIEHVKDLTEDAVEKVKDLADDFPENADPDARYDAIWSNPPIRIGKAALHELLLTWLPRLSPGGTARLVVSRNLGADSLQAWLRTEGYRCERVASAKGFRVFAVAGKVA